MNYATTERTVTHTAEEVEALRTLVADLRTALVEATADADLSATGRDVQSVGCCAGEGDRGAEGGVGAGEDEGGYEGRERKGLTLYQ